MQIIIRYYWRVAFSSLLRLRRWSFLRSALVIWIPRLRLTQCLPGSASRRQNRFRTQSIPLIFSSPNSHTCSFRACLIVAQCRLVMSAKLHMLHSNVRCGFKFSQLIILLSNDECLAGFGRKLSCLPIECKTRFIAF